MLLPGGKTESRANSRQSGRRGVRPRRGAGGDGEHPARHRRRGRAAADAHRGTPARSASWQDTTAERSGSEDMKRKSETVVVGTGSGTQEVVVTNRAIRATLGARGLRGRRQRGRAPCRDAGGQRPDGAAERQDHRTTGETMKIIILGRKNMKKLWKRNMVAGAVLLLVCRGDLSERTLRAAGGGDRQDPRAGHSGGRHGGRRREVSGEALPGDYFATRGSRASRPRQR